MTARQTSAERVAQSTEAIERDHGAAEPSAGPKASGGLIGRLGSLAIHHGALIIALIFLIALFSVLRPDSFFTLANLQSTLGIQAAAGLVGLGVMVVLLAGEFDLSVAATMGTSATLMAHGRSKIVLRGWVTIRGWVLRCDHERCGGQREVTKLR